MAEQRCPITECDTKTTEQQYKQRAIDFNDFESVRNDKIMICHHQKLVQSRDTDAP